MTTERIAPPIDLNERFESLGLPVDPERVVQSYNIEIMDDGRQHVTLDYGDLNPSTFLMPRTPVISFGTPKPPKFALGATQEMSYAVRIPDDYVWSPPPSTAFYKADLKPHLEHLDSLRFHLAAWTKTQPKETDMNIEKKNFTTPPIKTPAGSLAQRHLGSLVTITLASGAEITDVLVGVRSGVPSGLIQGDQGNVTLYLQNVGIGYDHNYLVDRNGAFPLEPKSIVLVRRPKAVRAAKVKR